MNLYTKEGNGQKVKTEKNVEKTKSNKIIENEKEKEKQVQKQKQKQKENEKSEEKLTKNIRIYSYNSRGFDLIKQKVCMELMNLAKPAVPILCNQANFVLKGNVHLIQQALSDYHVFFKPAKKENLEGRPVNGMFTAIPKQLRKKAKDVSPQNERIQGIKLDTDEGNILLVNAYFPPDPKTKAYQQDTDLEDVLASIENLIVTHQCRNVVIVGDLNTDYKRNNGRVNRLETFLSTNNLESSWSIFDIDYTHEFEKEDVTYTSTLDHVIWNTDLHEAVLDSGVLHVVTNTSDHSPIYCDLDISMEQNEESQLQFKGDKATISTKTLNDNDWSQFTTRLNQDLSQLRVPSCVKCRDVHCKDEMHVKKIDEYTRQVLKAVDNSIESIAKRKRNNIPEAKVVPGWSDLVKPFSDEAKFWSAVWVSAGKPLNTALHKLMKHTRNKYHYAIRKCKRASENILKDKMLNSCLAGKDNIFDKIHKMRRVKNDIPKKIDGHEKPSERFAEVYGQLYNSTNDKHETDAILNEVTSLIDDNSLKDIDLVTPEVIEDVVKEIKSNKRDPVFTFNSDCIKHAPSILHFHLATMIKLFLVHGHVSNNLLVATIVPLLKDKLGKIDSSDNYRSIALSSVILKIFDWVVITLFGERLGLDELQFSYQKKVSTNMCTWLVVESIGHFSRNNSNVYSCFMDMKKAFDLVKHGMLFKKLIDRGVPPVYLRLLLVMYMIQTARVKWDGTLSEAFSVLNGVKQGAVLSAILFCIYIDDLIKKLRRNRDGCWVNNEYVGIIVYADDIVLLSPTIDGLQNMIDTCSVYAESHNLKFSTHENPAKSKTKCVAFLQQKKELRKLNLNGKPLPWVESVKHLGTTITSSGGALLDQDLLEKRAQYIAKSNELNQEFHYSHPKTKVWINNVYNSSFYGAPLWDMFSKNFERLEKTWNVSVRKMLSLPRNAHRYFLEPLAETPHIMKCLWNRFVRFVTSIADGKKKVLRGMLRVIENDVRSVTGKNLRCIKLKTVNFDLNNLNVYELPYKAVPESELWRLPMAREILAARCGDLTTSLTKEEADELADHVFGSK